MKQQMPNCFRMRQVVRVIGPDKTNSIDKALKLNEIVRAFDDASSLLLLSDYDFQKKVEQVAYHIKMPEGTHRPLFTNFFIL